MTPEQLQTWNEIVADVKNPNLKSINVGSKKRREAIIALDNAISHIWALSVREKVGELRTELSKNQ